MSRASKNAPPADAAETMPFEVAIERLEAIVEAMESQDLPLESLISRFEEGSKLAAQCRKKLAEAELKIQQLEKKADGKLESKPFEDSPVPTD